MEAGALTGGGFFIDRRGCGRTGISRVARRAADPRNCDLPKENEAGSSSRLTDDNTNAKYGRDPLQPRG